MLGQEPVDGGLGEGGLESADGPSGNEGNRPRFSDAGKKGTRRPIQTRMGNENGAIMTLEMTAGEPIEIDIVATVVPMLVGWSRGARFARTASGLVGLAAVGLVMGCASEPAPGPNGSAGADGGRLTRLGSMIASRAAHTATTLPDGRLLIVGGFASGEDAASSAELYDHQSQKFQATHPLHEPRQSHTATLLDDLCRAVPSTAARGRADLGRDCRSHRRRHCDDRAQRVAGRDEGGLRSVDSPARCNAWGRGQARLRSRPLRARRTRFVRGRPR